MKRFFSNGALLRRLSGWVGAALVLVTPTAWAATQSTAAQQFTLANGMTLIVQPDRRAPTVAHMVWVRVGAMDEVDGTTGVAHVLEHMMFRGTPRVKAGEFSRRVAALGGRDNAFTTRDATVYHQQLPAQNLAAVMKLEADRLANNQWTDADFFRELEVVKEERRQRTEESARARMFEQFNATAFVASPYRRPVVGWMSDLDAMTPDDARAFYRRWYNPANAAVVVAGDVDVDQVRALAESIYGRLAARPVPARKPREEPVQLGPRRLDYLAAAEQAVVVLGYQVPKLTSVSATDAPTQDALALTVLSAVLDGYAGARMERALVQGESGAPRVADSAGASYGLFSRGPQLFTLSAVPAAGVPADTVLAALKGSVEAVAHDGISPEEMQRVITQWTASEIYKLDSVFNQAQELGNQWLNGLPLDTSAQLMQRLRGVTAEQVQSVAKRLFSDEQLTTAVLVPDPSKRIAAPKRANSVPIRH